MNDINIFDYFDYAEFLKDKYQWMKIHKTGFSFRSFARYAGIASHSYLIRIIKKQRKLRGDYINKFCSALKLNELEREYFTALVLFNNEKKAQQKENYLKEILNLRYNHKEEYRIEDKKLQFFQKWYYPLVREMAVLIDFKDDYNLLARKCIPKILPAQAKSAVRYLVENGFLEKDKQGHYKLTDYFISTGKEVNSTILRNYHRATLQQSADALDTIKPDERDVSSLTMRVNGETLKQMKIEIQNFRKMLLNMARESKDPNMVCYVGLQLLPRSEDIDLSQDTERPADEK